MILRSYIALLAIPLAAVFAAPVSEPVEDVRVEIGVLEPATYEIDTVHSELSFRIRHLMGRVAGTFNEWEGTVVVDPTDLAGGSVEVIVQTASINTLVEPRDDHLRTPDFFAVEDYPTMTFRSNRVEVDGERLTLHGDLTLRGVTRPVVLEGQYLGLLPADPWGQERISFLASTSINRQDFGVSFNQIVEGLPMIGDEVDIEIAIQAVKQ